MRVLICGSRSWSDEAAVARRVRELPDGAIVIHGGALGADRLAGQAATLWGLHSAVVQPLWGRFGQSAGHARNSAMLDLQPHLVVAFSLGTSGTQGTIDEARRRGIPVEVIGRESQAEPEGQSPSPEVGSSSPSTESL